jgi:Immunoglobulin-like domain of bacterial spore germination/Sporulation and spore germination
MTDDPKLSRLISDSVSDVEPGDGLSAIRSRTRGPQEKPMNQRNWLYAAGGAVVATAAVIVAIALVGTLGNGSSGPDAAGTSTGGAPTTEPTDAPSPSVSATDSPTTPTTPTPSASGTPAESAVAVYYLGDGPRGPVLFREFQRSAAGDLLTDAVNRAIGGRPSDPDYHSGWVSGVTATASAAGSSIVVDLSGPAGTALADDPRQGRLAIQQVVYTAQAALQDRRPVTFLIDGKPASSLLGLEVGGPVEAAPVLKTLSLMSITTPEEGQVVSGSFEASGVNNSFEASVSYEIRSGDQVVASGFGMAEGWGEDKLFPWTLTVDLAGVAPGTYAFVAMNDDPSGGEGPGPDIDTRTIVVQ